MKSAKRKRCSTNENQEVESLLCPTKQQLNNMSNSAKNTVPTVDPTQYYFNQPPKAADEIGKSRLSSLAMPPPPAPPLPLVQPIPFDYFNYNAYYQNMYASNSAVAVAAAAAAAAVSTHQSYLNYNQFLTANNNNNNNSSLVHPNQQNITASSYLKYNKNEDNNKTGDMSEEIDAENNNNNKFANFYNYSYLANNSSSFNPKQALHGGNSGAFLTLDNLNSSNIVAAKKSSYYCLTPASSTTSLSDLNNSKSLLEDFNSANNVSAIVGHKKSSSAKTKQKLATQQSLSSIHLNAQKKEVEETHQVLARSNSYKRTRLSIDTYKCADLDSNTSQNNNKLAHTLSASTFMQPTTTVALNNREVTVGGRGRRGRGRPPKNAHLIINNSTEASLVPNSNDLNRVELKSNVNTEVNNKKQFEDFEEQKETKNTQNEDVSIATMVGQVTGAKQSDSSVTANNNKANSKLIKSLINKSSSNSNLQKSKVQVDSTENKSSGSKPITKSESSSNLQQKKINPVAINSNSNHQPLGYLIDKVNDATYLNKQQQLQPSVYYLNNLNQNVGKKINADTENNYIICAKSNLYPSSEQHCIKPTNTNIPQQLNEEVVASEQEHTPMLNLNWANGADLWKVMRLKELKYAHDHLYLKRHLGIEPQMRAILLDWLVEISYAYRLHRETWHLAVEYMDRFMTCCKSQMRVDRLQLIGMSALFLAAKVEEIYPPKLKEFASHMENYTQNNEDAIQQFELFILKTLNWEISPVTANTWLMTYMQIASINYYTNLKNYYNRDEEDETKQAARSNSKVHNSHMVMPLNIYKNSNLKDFKSNTNIKNQNKTTYIQQQFYLNNYMKSVTLLDLCMFDMESLKYTYSELAAAAMYHMLSFETSSIGITPTPTATAATTSSSSSQNDAHLNAYIVRQCTGYTLYELDSCIKWMYPYSDVCKDILTDEKMTHIKSFSNVDPEDAHNIQLYYQNLDLLKEAHSRKTPSKYYLSASSNTQSHSQLLLTPPDSHRKSSSSMSSTSMLSTTSLLSTPATFNSTTVLENK